MQIDFNEKEVETVLDALRLAGECYGVNRFSAPESSDLYFQQRELETKTWRLHDRIIKKVNKQERKRLEELTGANA